MFENIGGKIKGLARITAILGIMAFVIYGIVLFSVSVLMGILVAVIGSLASWIGGFTLYGFGELIDATQSLNVKMNRVCEIQEQIMKIVSERTVVTSTVTEPVEQPAVKMNAPVYEKCEAWECSFCKTRNDEDRSECKRCGYPRR